MKICPRCQKTYSDDGLNFCLDDGSTLSPINAGDSSSQPTVQINHSRPTDQNRSFGSQPGGQSGWNPPNQFAPPPSTPKKSKSWLWALGILGGLILICGGGLTGFLFWAASLEKDNRNAVANYDFNTAQKSPSPTVKVGVQKIDLSKWVQNDAGKGLTEFKNGEFLMNSKSKGFYYVLLSSVFYKTENATTKVTVKNVNEDSTNLGFGLIIHSNPVPLMQDYAFLIDSENKKYRLVRHVPGDEKVVANWTRSAAIKDGAAENVLEVRDQNQKMNFYINGEFIKAFDNDEGYSGGVAGIYAGDAVQIAFTDLEIAK